MGCGKCLNVKNTFTKSNNPQGEESEQAKISQNEGNIEKIIENSEIQEQADKAVKLILKAAQSGDLIQLRKSRQDFQILNLKQINASYFIAQNMMNALESLFYNRGYQVNFMAELKHFSKICRNFITHFFGNKNLFQAKDQTKYLDTIKRIKTSIKQEKQENYDFGVYLELEIIYSVIRITKNDKQIVKTLIDHACMIFNAAYNKSTKDLIALCQSIVLLADKIVSHQFIQIVAEMELLVTNLRSNLKEKSNDVDPVNTIKQILIIFNSHSK